MHGPTDAESHAAVIAVLRGKRIPLDAGSLKMLAFLLDDPSGCDAELTPDAFTVRFGWNYGPHSYFLWCAPGALSFLLEGTELPPTRRLTRQIGPGTLPQLGNSPPDRPYPARYVRIEALVGRTLIRVREHEAALDISIVEPPHDGPRFVAIPRECRHCGVVPDRYRVLGDRSLVCLACGRSQPA